MTGIPADAKHATARERSRQTDNLLSIKRLCSLVGA